nr:hypothetical protein [Komagataeibacter rhaeticus]
MPRITAIQPRNQIGQRCEVDRYDGWIIRVRENRAQFYDVRREFRYPENRHAAGRLRRIDREIANPIVRKRLSSPLPSEPRAFLFAETRDDIRRHVEDIPRPCRRLQCLLRVRKRPATANLISASRYPSSCACFWQQDNHDARWEGFVQTAFGDMSIS